MVGILNASNVTMANLTSVGNVTNPLEFMVNVNHTIYNGWLFFILCLLLLIVLYIAAQQVEDQPITNIMYSSAAVSIGSLFLRAANIYYTSSGVWLGLLTDNQMYVFPLITIITAAILVLIKKT